MKNSFNLQFFTEETYNEKHTLNSIMVGQDCDTGEITITSTFTFRYKNDEDMRCKLNIIILDNDLNNKYIKDLINANSNEKISIIIPTLPLLCKVINSISRYHNKIYPIFKNVKLIKETSYINKFVPNYRKEYSLYYTLSDNDKENIKIELGYSMDENESINEVSKFIDKNLFDSLSLYADKDYVLKSIYDVSTINSNFYHGIFYKQTIPNTSIFINNKKEDYYLSSYIIDDIFNKIIDITFRNDEYINYLYQYTSFNKIEKGKNLNLIKLVDNNSLTSIFGFITYKLYENSNDELDIELELLSNFIVNKITNIDLKELILEISNKFKDYYMDFDLNKTNPEKIIIFLRNKLNPSESYISLTIEDYKKNNKRNINLKRYFLYKYLSNYFFFK